MDYLDELEMGQRDSELIQSLRIERDQHKAFLDRLVMEDQDILVNMKVGTTGAEEDDTTDKRSEHQLLMNRIQMYSMIGIGVEPDDNDGLTVKFQPAYRGHHHSEDKYSIQCDRKRDNYRLAHHNLPPFVPVQYLAEECLDAGEIGLRKFISQLYKYLYLYTYRRGMVRDVQTELSNHLLKGPDTNPAVTHVHMRLSPSNTMPDISVTLTYNLMKGHPESAEVKFGGTVKGESKLTEDQKQMEKELCTRLVTEDLCSSLHSVLEPK